MMIKMTALYLLPPVPVFAQALADVEDLICSIVIDSF
jgi:hypothetical protein